MQSRRRQPSPESRSSPLAPPDVASGPDFVVLDGRMYARLPSARPFGFAEHRAFLDGLFEEAEIEDIGDVVVFRIKAARWNRRIDEYNDEFIRQMFL